MNLISDSKAVYAISPARVWFDVAGVSAIIGLIGLLYVHVRGIGYDACEAQVTKATADIQAKLDSEQSAAAQAVAKYHVLDQAIKNAAYPPRPAIAICADADPRVVQRANADN